MTQQEHSRRANIWWLVAGIWLIFLVFPVLAALDAEVSTLVKAVTLTLIGAFAAVYCLTFAERMRPIVGFLTLLVLTAGTVPVIWEQAIGMVPFLCVAAILMLPWPWWPYVGATTALLPLLATLGESDFPVAYFLLLVWPLSAGMVVLRIIAGAEERGDAARAEHALVSERERVARDVHDVLGHSLTVLSVKAELAARLIDADPDRARAELESIQQIARQALSEVRLTVGGLRASSLPTEVEAAPTVLRDVGVDARVVGDVADTDPQRRTLLAWVLREAVTNVVRHAEATSVVIELRDDGMVVTDDGRGWSGFEGNGLRGMRERVEQAGGTLTLTAIDPGTRMQVQFT